MFFTWTLVTSTFQPNEYKLNAHFSFLYTDEERWMRVHVWNECTTTAPKIVTKYANDNFIALSPSHTFIRILLVLCAFVLLSFILFMLKKQQFLLFIQLHFCLHTNTTIRWRWANTHAHTPLHKYVSRRVCILNRLYSNDNNHLSFQFYYYNVYIYTWVLMDILYLCGCTCMPKCI